MSGRQMRDNELSQTNTKGIIMGWGSGGYIFNGMADALIKAGASEEIKHKALSKVIGQLQQEDWDTELDSLQDYLDDPGIVAAFADHDIRWDTDDETDADSDVFALIAEIASRLTDATDEGEYHAASLIGDLANGRKTVAEARADLADITFRHV